MEEITTRDESSHISANGQRVLPSGGISADGPPTTLSGTGVDRSFTWHEATTPGNPSVTSSPGISPLHNRTISLVVFLFLTNFVA